MSPAIAEASPKSLACPISAAPEDVYQARKPKESPLWQIVERHFDEFLQVYDERFAPAYRPLRTGVRHALEAFRKCGILDWGFARVRCPECSLDWHPHIHLLISWGLFAREGAFIPVDATPDTEIVAKLFRHKVLRLLLDEGAIDEQVVANLLAWPHTGFGAHVSREIPADPVSRENAARYLAHPPIILDRIVGDPSAGKVLYTGEAIHPRHQANFRVFDPLACLAEISAHIPDPYEKTALYYGWYSNRTRGFRRARGLLAAGGPDVPVPEADRTPLALRRSWARLIRKVYEVNPLLCSGCGATMKVIAVIEDEEVISRILAHLHLLAPGDGPRAPPKSAGLRELISEPVFDLPVRRTQTGDLPWMDPA